MLKIHKIYEENSSEQCGFCRNIQIDGEFDGERVEVGAHFHTGVGPLLCDHAHIGLSVRTENLNRV